MKFCKQCGVSVSVPRERCPLCQGLLTGGDGEEREIFPDLPTLYHQHSLFFRILIFVSIAAGTITVIVNFLVESESWWSLIVLAGLGAMWLIIAASVRKRSSPSKTIVIQAVLLSILLPAIDAFTGWHRWAIDYVIPVLMIFGMFASLVVSKIMGRRMEDYLIHLLVNGLLGLIPLIFVLTGWADVIWPSMISVGVSVLCVSALVLVGGRKTTDELKKRLHI